MSEIFKPTEATFYRAHGPGVIHEGITNIGLVTTTGQPSLIYSADPGEFAGLVANSGSAVEPMPATGEEVTRGTVYEFEGWFMSASRATRAPSITPARSRHCSRQQGRNWTAGYGRPERRMLTPLAIWSSGIARKTADKTGCSGPRSMRTPRSPPATARLIAGGSLLLAPNF